MTKSDRDDIYAKIYAEHDKAIGEIYAKEEMNKNMALAFVLAALLAPFVCWFFDMWSKR